jgi:transposase
MRGYDRPQSTMLSLVNPEQRVPAKHPIRLIKELAEVALKELSPLFEQMYSEVGRPSIPRERLLKASLLMALYTVRKWDRFCPKTLPCPKSVFTDVGESLQIRLPKSD